MITRKAGEIFYDPNIREYVRAVSDPDCSCENCLYNSSGGQHLCFADIEVAGSCSKIHRTSRDNVYFTLHRLS